MINFIISHFGDYIFSHLKSYDCIARRLNLANYCNIDHIRNIEVEGNKLNISEVHSFSIIEENSRLIIKLSLHTYITLIINILGDTSTNQENSKQILITGLDFSFAINNDLSVSPNDIFVYSYE